MRVFGIDVAFSNDKTVVAIRDDIIIYPLITVNSCDPKHTAQMICDLYERYNPHIVNVDTIGIGISIVSWLQSYKIPTYALDVRTRKNKKFKNRRAELYWELRERLNPANVSAWQNDQSFKKKLQDKYTKRDLISPLFLPNDEELINQLGTMHYKFDETDGSLFIESKISLRKRLGESPDKADAVVYSLPEDGYNQSQLSHCDYNLFRMPQSSKWKI